MTAQHGVLVVDKPSGPSSHDIVNGARRVLGTRAIGHAGTLDPLASGVLVLLVGEATKLSSYLTAASKLYETTVTFGVETDTLDSLGHVTRSVSFEACTLTPEALEAALAVERARTEQVPPVFSAIKVAGRRAYRAGRAGEHLEMAPRAVHIEQAELVGVSDGTATFRLLVSKGYYIRAFARDLGHTLGLPAHVSALKRLSSGCFRIDEAMSWPLVPNTPLLPLGEAARRAMPAAVLTEAGVARARLGQRLSAEDFRQTTATHGDDGAAWLSPEGELVAIGRHAEQDGYRVVRGFGVAQRTSPSSAEGAPAVEV
jgi:tRNA pseudouridine55 synthase